MCINTKRNPTKYETSRRQEAPFHTDFQSCMKWNVIIYKLLRQQFSSLVLPNNVFTICTVCKITVYNGSRKIFFSTPYN